MKRRNGRVTGNIKLVSKKKLAYENKLTVCVYRLDEAIGTEGGFIAR